MSQFGELVCSRCHERQCVALYDPKLECRFRYMFEDGELSIEEVISAIATLVDDETRPLRERIERLRRVRFELEHRLSELVRRQS